MVISASIENTRVLNIEVGKKISIVDAQKELKIANNLIYKIIPVTPDEKGLSKRFTVTLAQDLDILVPNYISFNENKKAINIGEYVRSKEFDEKYYYSGDDLGVTYSKNKTQIKLWAPTANKVSLQLYYLPINSQQTAQVIEMQRSNNGIWVAMLDGDYQGWAYDYQVSFGDGTTTTTNDPYSRAVTINGNRSIILDTNNIKPDNFNRMSDFGSQTNAVIYETSVRDFTKDPNSGVTNKGKFLGMVEKGTHTKSGQITGIDYLKDLGITHVQLMPMFDFASIDESLASPDYNWGYDPKNYNVPEGSYSTNPTDPKNRILEMKEMINGFHKSGIRVVMDVVYNHVYSMDEQFFQKVVPGYYYQYDSEGHTTNGTGVGNDIASERKMVRKYILDSVNYWAKEYNIDGFRFDLMGILDIDTMNEIRTELNKINPGILVYGEGWDMRATNHDIGAAQYNADKLDKRVGFFSDDIRNTIRGAEFGGLSKGLVEGNGAEKDYEKNAKAFVDGFMGGENYLTVSHPYKAPTQTINYVDCHDNRTLYDMLKVQMPKESETNLQKRAELATSMAFLATGVPFVHSGQEFLRTKDGNDNSYNSSDLVNQINWDYADANSDTISYFKQLIDLRKNEKMFRIDNYQQVSKTVKIIDSGTDGVFAFKYQGDTHNIIIIFNVNDKMTTFNNYNLMNGKILLSSDNNMTKIGKVSTLAPLSTLVVQESI